MRLLVVSYIHIESFNIGIVGIIQTLTTAVYISLHVIRNRIPKLQYYFDTIMFFMCQKANQLIFFAHQDKESEMMMMKGG